MGLGFRVNKDGKGGKPSEAVFLVFFIFFPSRFEKIISHF